MKTYPDLIACEHCDTVYRRRSLAQGEVASCPVCAAVLYRGSRLDLDRWLALTVAAAIVFVIANINPVIRISFQGLSNDATLWQAAVALDYGWVAPIAIPAAMTVIIVPFMQIALLGWVLIHARRGRRAPGFSAAVRTLVALRPWSMVEVALLGIMVSVVKLSGYMQVAPGAGIWATAALMVLIVLIAKRDLQPLWQMTEMSCRPEKHAACVESGAAVERRLP